MGGMMRRRQMSHQGKTLDVMDMDFEIVQESWNEYKLLDGGVIRMKTTPFEIVRVLDQNGKPAVTKHGDPFVLVRHSTHILAREGV